MGNYEVIICIVNKGFQDAVMDAAREFGATGGTVISARGTASPEAESVFGLSVQPEKEIVMILVDGKIKNDILHALYNKVGLSTPGGGIAYSMPVSEVVGIKPRGAESKEEKPAVSDKAADAQVKTE